MEVIKIENNILNEALENLGELIATNLSAMGVPSANASDGLTTLVGKILDIEPSINGLDFDTSITLHSSESTITTGDTIRLSATLKASYDDTSITNVDLEGVLTGATVQFLNGSTILGTGVTDTNGVATFNYIPLDTGSLTLRCKFLGTDNFNTCESSNINVSVVEPVVTSISLSTSKSILSKYDSESSLLTAIVRDQFNKPVPNQTVTFKRGTDTLSSVTTGSTGEATYNYVSTGGGDTSITANTGTLSNEVIIEDCIYFSPEERIFTKDSATYIPFDNNLILELPSKYEWSVDLKQTGAAYDEEHRMYLAPSEKVEESLISNKQPNPSIMVGYSYVDAQWGTRTTSSNVSGTPVSGLSGKYHSFKITREDESFNCIIDGENVSTKTFPDLHNGYSQFKFLMVIWGSGNMGVKNLKIKAL